MFETGKEVFMQEDIRHYAFASDEKFVPQLQVAAASLLKACSNTSGTLHIHVLDCGIDDMSYNEAADRLRLLSNRFSVDCKIFRHNIDMSLFARFRTWNSSRAAYARLMLPLLLDGIEYCIYSDCDMLFIEDPRMLVHELKTSGAAVLGHRNPIGRDGETIDLKWFERHREPFNRETYFCSGLIAMDLEKFRRPGALDAMFDFLARHPDAISADQAALNWYFRNESALATDGWGLFQSECFGDKHPIRAIHYSGGSPWKKPPSWYEYIMTRKVDMLWLSFARKILPPAIFESLPVEGANFRSKTTGVAAMLAARCLLYAGIRPAKIRHFLEDVEARVRFDRNLATAMDRLLSGLD